MRYLLGKNKTPIDLEQDDVIGSGGEAIVFAHPTQPDKAFKVYHDPTLSRSHKLESFFQQNLQLPANIIVPEEPLFAANGRTVVGFMMRRLPGNFIPLALLMRADFCNQNAISTKIKINICISLLKGLLAIHRYPGICVGDLNDQNEIIIDPRTGEVYWIDVDSWHLSDKFPCVVGTEDYLSPDLYGKDLSRQAYFKPKHDYYSFSTLLFRILMMTHPFGGGVHKQFLSLFDRATHGLTVLDPAVRYPKKAKPREVLTDELSEIIQRYLKRQCDDPFPLAELEKYAGLLIECSHCHLDYPATRDNCPGCAAKTVAKAKLTAKISGCICDIILETPGRIIWHQLSGKDLCVLTDEDDLTVFYRKSPNGQLERKELFKTLTGARYAFFDNVLTVCVDPSAENPELLLIDISGNRPQGISKSSTNCYSGGTAVFASSGRRLYRLSGNSLMSGELFGKSLSDRQVMETIGRQTKIFVADNHELTDNHEVVLVVQRILGDLHWFMAVGDTEGKNFKRLQLSIAELDDQESIIDASVRFGGKTILILRHTREHGVNFVRLDQINIFDGKVSQSKKIKVSEAKQFEEIHGKGFTDEAILHATDDGVKLQNLADNNLLTLPGTDNYISGGERLLRYGNGIIAISGDKIISLRPEK
ncbi:MAG: hypothetical protein WC473_02205 [Patescibacteria group bacterium]